MILITGATGFVGRRVVEALASAGRPVRALVHTASRARVLSHHDVEIVHGDVLDPESLARACHGVDSVIHLVAIFRESWDMSFQQLNYQGTKNVLEAAASAGVKRIVHSSIIGATSDPAFSFLYSRWMAEQEMVRSQMAHTIVRFSIGFGEGDEFFNVLAAQVKLSPIVPVAGDGRTRVQPIAVEDVARCLVTAYETDNTVGSTIEVGGPEHFTYEQILDLIAETLGARIFKLHIPVSLMRHAVGLMEIVMPRPPITREQLKMLPLDVSTELDSVQRAFGFVPRSLRGNMDFISRIGLGDALKINLGIMPARIRDH